MLANYFKTAWRNITRTIGYSLLNISGLAIGMGIALLIGLWVHYQYSFDRFLPESKSVYRVQRNFDSNGDTLTFQTTSFALAEALHNQIPEIEYVAASDWMGSHGLMADNKKLYQNGAIAGENFFRIFQFPFLRGNAGAVFKDPYSIVLTESTARALFGSEDAMNKMVRLDNIDNFRVTGILKDIPANSSLQFNFVVPVSYQLQKYPEILKGPQSFSNNNLQIFVKLKSGVAYLRVAPKIRNIEHTETGNTNAMRSYITFQPMSRWHLYSKYINGQDTEGFLTYVKMFSIIGLLVLAIACINFINLTTARSEKRAKEVGVRKAIGSRRKDLIVQFLIEALLLTSFAFLFSVLIVLFVLPYFNELTGTQIMLPYTSFYFWMIILSALLFTALLAGSRPAFYLSSFNPVRVLKSINQSGKRALFSRKVLVVLQFSCSVALIITTVIIYQQIRYAKDRPTGYDIDRLMTTNMNDDLTKNFAALKNELLSKGIVSSVTTATSPATDVWWHTDIDTWPGKNAGETVEMGNIYVSEDYFKTIGMRLLDGRDFSNGYDSTSVIFNEAAIRRLRIKNPVGQKIGNDGRSFTIVGIVKDALMISPFKAADPTMFYCFPKPQGSLLYRLAANVKTDEALRQLTKLFNKYNPSSPYNYTFADADYASKFNLEILIGKLSGLFASLAIFISCLGLFGLAAYIAEQRKKEIGIRKVLGASVRQVWVLLSKEFVVLVVISCVIAAPVSYYFLKNWLMNYEYRIGIGAGVFIASALVALMITIITISFQAIKAALVNPAKSLRSE